MSLSAPFAVRVKRLTPLRWNVEICDAGTEKLLWSGVMGDGVIEALGKRSVAFFMAHWKMVPEIEPVLILREEIKDPHG